MHNQARIDNQGNNGYNGANGGHNGNIINPNQIEGGVDNQNYTMIRNPFYQ